MAAPKAIADGYALLAELGAVDESHKLTPLGEQLDVMNKLASELGMPPSYTTSVTGRGGTHAAWARAGSAQTHRARRRTMGFMTAPRSAPSPPRPTSA